MSDIRLMVRLLESQAVRYSDQVVDMDTNSQAKELAECLYRAAFDLQTSNIPASFDQPAPLYADQAYALIGNAELRERLISALNSTPTTESTDT